MTGVVTRIVSLVYCVYCLLLCPAMLRQLSVQSRVGLLVVLCERYKWLPCSNGMYNILHYTHHSLFDVPGFPPVLMLYTVSSIHMRKENENGADGEHIHQILLMLSND